MAELISLNLENLVIKKSTYTPAQKRATDKWREQNRDQYRKYVNKWALDNYYKKAEKYKEYARIKYKEKMNLLGLEVKERPRK